MPRISRIGLPQVGQFIAVILNQRISDQTPESVRRFILGAVAVLLGELLVEEYVNHL